MGMNSFEKEFHFALWSTRLGQFEEFKDEPFPLPQSFEEHLANVRAYHESEIGKRNQARHKKLWEIRNSWSIPYEETSS